VMPPSVRPASPATTIAVRLVGECCIPSIACSWICAQSATRHARTGAGSASAPQLLAGDFRALNERLEFRPDDARMHLLRAGEGGEAAIGTGDDVLAPHHFGIAADSLGDQLGMFDQNRRMADHAGNERLARRQFGALPHFPFMLVARVRGLE